MKTLISQANAILKHLQDGNGITPMDALNLCGCFRLSARIADLKKMGYLFSVEMKKGKNRYGEPTHYAEYRLIEVED